jgi:hypothetical protein
MVGANRGLQQGTSVVNAIRAVILSLLAASLAACSSSKDKTPIKQVTPTVTRDVPNVLRGLVSSEATLLKADPILVSGYGLVVGLPGTGGGDLDEKLFATMDRQLGLMGIGKGSPGLEGTPLAGQIARRSAPLQGSRGCRRLRQRHPRRPGRRELRCLRPLRQHVAGHLP